VRLDDLVRLAGPEEDALVRVAPDEWEDDVDDMQESLEQGWEPPPLLAEYQSGRLLLQDGNHRYEALARAREREAWVLVYFNDPVERDAFRADERGRGRAARKRRPSDFTFGVRTDLRPDGLSVLPDVGAPSPRQRVDDVKSEAAGPVEPMGLGYETSGVRIAVGHFDAHHTALAADADLDRLCAVEDSVGDQLAQHHQGDSGLGEESVLDCEPRQLMACFGRTCCPLR
jgi:ParB-like nuclease domain